MSAKEKRAEMVRKRDDESRHRAVPGAEAGDLVPGAEAGDLVPGAEAGDLVPGAEAGDLLPGAEGGDLVPGAEAGDLLPGLCAQADVQHDTLHEVIICGYFIELTI